MHLRSDHSDHICILFAGVHNIGGLRWCSHVENKRRGNGGQNMIKCPLGCSSSALSAHRRPFAHSWWPFLFFCRCPSNILSLPLILGHTEGPPKIHETNRSHNSRQKGLHTVYLPFLFLNCKSHGSPTDQKLRLFMNRCVKKGRKKTII